MQKLKNIIFGIGAVAFTAFYITTIIFFVDLFFDFSVETFLICKFGLAFAIVSMLFMFIHDHLLD